MGIEFKKFNNIKRQEDEGGETKIFENPLKELIVLIENGGERTGPKPKDPNLPKFESEDSSEEPKKDPPEPEEDSSEEESSEEEKPRENPWENRLIEKSPIDRKTVEDFLNYQKEKKDEENKKKMEEEERKRLTPKERAKKAQKIEDEEFIRDYFKENSEEEIKKILKTSREYRQLEESVEPYIKDLAEVFEQVMQSVSQQITLAWDEGWRSGRFNIERFIKKYGAYIQEGAPPLQFSELDVYDQRDFIERLRLFPEKIRVRLVLDGSGSMDTEKLLSLKQLSILIMEALSAFEFTINLRFKLKKPIRIDTEIRMFGSVGRSEIIKPFAEFKDYNPEDARADRIKSFLFIHSNYGSTCDAEPWWKIDASLNNQKYLEDLRKGRAKEFVFEITDGGSNESTNPRISPEQDTRDAIWAVEQKGIIARGFQIGTPSKEEEMIFNKIWGKNGFKIDHPKNLAAAITKTLSEEIRKIQFKVQYEEIEEE